MKILSILSLLFFVSCSTKLDEAVTMKVDQKMKKKTTIRYYSSDKYIDYSYSHFEIEKKLDRTPADDEKFVQSKLMLSQMGAPDADYDYARYNIHLKYTADKDGLVVANGSIFENMEVYNEHLKNLIEYKTTYVKCVKHHGIGWNKRCVKEKRVKVDDHEAKEKELRSAYAVSKEFKKGDIILSRPYEIWTEVVGVQGKNEINVGYKEI